MAKQRSNSQRKKRSKQYQGQDAAMKSPKVTRVVAVQKSKPRQWWDENKQKIIASGVVFALILIIYVILNFLLRWIF